MIFQNLQEGLDLCKKLITLRDNMRFFSKVRDGVQFHPPKNLSTALVVEAAELVKYFNGLMRNKVSISPPTNTQRIRPRNNSRKNSVS